MKLIEDITKLVSEKLQLSQHKKQLKIKYVTFGNLVLSRYVLPGLSVVMKHLSDNVDQKDLSEVPMTPELLSHVINNRSYTLFPYSESWVKNSFEDLGKHPVLKSRRDFERKNNIVPKTNKVKAATVTSKKSVVSKKKTEIKPRAPAKVVKSFGGGFRRVEGE
jgi:hypothetical protein